MIRPYEKHRLKSSKYNYTGRVYDYGTLVEVKCDYAEIHQKKIYHKEPDEGIFESAIHVMDFLIDSLHEADDISTLNDWHIEPNDGNPAVSGYITGGPYYLLQSVVIRDLKLDPKHGELLLRDSIQELRCPLKYCNFDEQDKYPEMLPKYEELKQRYQHPLPLPEIEPGKILLSLCDYRTDNFSSIYETDEYGHVYEYTHHSQGKGYCSYCDIRCTDNPVRISYYPDSSVINFYAIETDGRPLYVENTGDHSLLLLCKKLVFRLAPGERKELAPENAEPNIPVAYDGKRWVAAK